MADPREKAARVRRRGLSGATARPRPTGRRPERRRGGPRRRVDLSRLRHRVSPRRLLVGGGVTLVVGALLAWLLLASPWLRVAGVSVVGGPGPVPDDVRQIAQENVGRPLVEVDGPALAERLSRVPSVARVDVLRDWPNALSVVVQLRDPVARTKNSQGVVELVDVDGVSYPPVGEVPAGLPEATLEHPGEARELAALGGVLGALDAGQRARVSAVKASSPDDVRFTVDGVAVIWGGPGRGRQKAIVMAALLRQQGVRTVNVSAPDSPVAS